MKEGLGERNGWEIMSRRKYSPGDGAKRGKKGGRKEGRREGGSGRKTRTTFLPDIWDGLLSVRTSVSLEHHLSSKAVAVRPSPPSLPPSAFYLIRVGPARGNFHDFSAAARNVVFVLNEITTDHPPHSFPFRTKPANIIYDHRALLPFPANSPKEVRDNLSIFEGFFGRYRFSRICTAYVIAGGDRR